MPFVPNVTVEHTTLCYQRLSIASYVYTSLLLENLCIFVSFYSHNLMYQLRTYFEGLYMDVQLCSKNTRQFSQLPDLTSIKISWKDNTRSHDHCSVSESDCHSPSISFHTKYIIHVPCITTVPPVHCQGTARVLPKYHFLVVEWCYWHYQSNNWGSWQLFPQC